MTDHRANLIETLTTVAETFMDNGLNEYETVVVRDGVLKVETYTATGDVEHTYTVDLTELPMTVDGQALPARYDADRIELVYADDTRGETTTQSISDLLEAGTAIDPETEDELDIVAVHVHAGPAAEAVCAREEEPAEPNTLSARVLHNTWSGQVVAWAVHRDEDALDEWEHEHLDDDPRAEMFGADLVVADDADPTVRNPAMFVEFFGAAAVLVASDRKTLWSLREQWAAEHGDPDDPQHALTRQSEFRIQLEQSH